MKSNVLKISMAVVFGLLTLTSTAVASYKVINQSKQKINSNVIPSIEPEVIEQTEIIDEIEIVANSNDTNSATTLPNFQPISQNSNQNKPNPSPIPSSKGKFVDDEDDEVEFEDDEDEEDSDDSIDEDDEDMEDIEVRR